MTFDFHPEAETEFLEAIAYYEECEAGLGEDFSLEVYLDDCDLFGMTKIKIL